MNPYTIDDKGNWYEVWLCQPPDHFVHYYVMDDEWVKRLDGKFDRLIKRIQIAEPLLLQGKQELKTA